VSSDAVATEIPRLSRYAESKWLAETELELADETFTVTSLRFGTACGMSDRLRLDVVLNHCVGDRDQVDWAIVRDPAKGGGFLAVNAGWTNGTTAFVISRRRWRGRFSMCRLPGPRARQGAPTGSASDATERSPRTTKRKST
jgi:hypothetical protein